MEGMTIDSETATADDRRYAAIRARDARFDGRFVMAVATTGVY